MQEKDFGTEQLAETEEYAINRWVPVTVVLGAVIGFVALAWYAYHAGTQSVGEDDLLVVEADKTPLKEKPDDPGGMKFPNQDKTIFDTFASQNAQAPAKVERVLPAPEEPMDAGQTTTWVNEKLQSNDTAPAAAPSAKPEQVIGADTEPQVEAAKPTAPFSPPPIEAEKKTAPAPDIQSYTRVTPSEETSAPAAKEEPKKEEAAKPVKQAAKPASGKAQAQLGAYRSEKEARDSWDKMQKKYSELKGRVPLIVKADLGDKGIFYRLRVGGFSPADAKAFCSGLAGKGQSCILASK